MKVYVLTSEGSLNPSVFTSLKRGVSSIFCEMSEHQKGLIDDPKNFITQEVKQHGYFQLTNSYSVRFRLTKFEDRELNAGANCLFKL